MDSSEPSTHCRLEDLSDDELSDYLGICVEFDPDTNTRELFILTLLTNGRKIRPQTVRDRWRQRWLGWFRVFWYFRRWPPGFVLFYTVFLCPPVQQPPPECIWCGNRNNETPIHIFEIPEKNLEFTFHTYCATKICKVLQTINSTPVIMELVGTYSGKNTPVRWARNPAALVDVETNLSSILAKSLPNCALCNDDYSHRFIVHTPKGITFYCTACLIHTTRFIHATNAHLPGLYFFYASQT